MNKEYLFTIQIYLVKIISGNINFVPYNKNNGIYAIRKPNLMNKAHPNGSYNTPNLTTTVVGSKVVVVATSDIFFEAVDR